MQMFELKIHIALDLGNFQSRQSRDKNCSDPFRIKALTMVRKLGILWFGVS